MLLVVLIINLPGLGSIAEMIGHVTGFGIIYMIPLVIAAVSKKLRNKFSNNKTDNEKSTIDETKGQRKSTWRKIGQMIERVF